jgi:hypothetical protein
MKHLPSIEALTDSDDRRLLAELEICQLLEKLARVRALVDRADHLITTPLANRDDPAACGADAERLCLAILATIRKG